MVPLKMKNDNKEILIFPVGPLNVRLELAKRIQFHHPGSSVTLLLRRDEQRIELPREGLRMGYRLLSRCPLSYLKKSGVVPIYHNAWRKSFLKMAGLAFLSGASPISVCGEGGELLEKKAASIFLGQFSFVLLSSFLYPLARIIRSFLPLISKLRHKDREFSRTEKTWLIIPIYPDLSHHFIFQQVLHLSQLVPSEVVSVLKGELKYRPHYMEPLDQRIKYLPVPERLCIATAKGFFLLAFTRPRKLLEACLKIEDAAREEGEEIWSLKGFLSPFNPLNGLALYLLSKGQIPKKIHTYGLTIPTNYGLFFSMIFDIPQTATYYIDVPKGIPSRFFRLKKERLEKVIVHTRHCIQEVGELMGVLPEKVALIPFGTSLTEAIPIDGVRQPVELLTVGRLIPKKGVHILIEACEILKKKGYPLPCLIVGNGPELPHLQAAVREAGLEKTVTFLGGKSYDDYLSLLKPHRILVQPSVIAESGDHDGVPSVILDGMARGLIVIGTRIGGIPEAIQDNKNGFLVPSNDPKALANCIEKVLTGREIHHRISQAARSTILEHYDVKNLSKKMAEECGFVGIGATAERGK
jgi:glycosyltransferase involved in cell wall biosynthesis